ncbi:MAG: LamG-like jellyroll fold domain-containing protein [Nannocystaceae bacterium]
MSGFWHGKPPLLPVVGLVCAGVIFGCSGPAATTIESDTQASQVTTAEGPSSTSPTTATSEGPTDTNEPETTQASGCDPEQFACGDLCVDLASDPDHCGSCDLACTEGNVCQAGSCQPDCGELSPCAGGCFDTTIEPAHCGGCDQACAHNEVCAAGTCLPACGQGQAICSGVCTSLFSDPQNCGSCNHACPPPLDFGEAGCHGSGTCTFNCDIYHHPAPPLEPQNCSVCSDDPVLDDNPIHYWRMSEVNGNVAVDDVGGADATYTDVVLDQVGVLAPMDRAAVFGTTSASEARIESMPFPTQAITAEVVVRIDDPEQPLHPFLSLASGDGWEANEFVFYHRIGGDIQGLHLIVAQTHEWSTPVRIDDGAWHHLAVSWSSSAGASIYVNGARVAHQPNLGKNQAISPVNTLIFGQEQDLLGGGFDPTQYLKGAIDSIVVFDKVLSEEQIFVHATSVMCSGA